ncbi:MAG TPA: hypothetical protein VKD90_06460 [Gemmataceae bacterium]|nr:hypothetical protein [Gemmataceae bacterium]
MSRTNRLRLEALEGREVPAGDLGFAFTLPGLPADAVTRVAADAAGNVYVAGTFSGTVDLDPSPTAQMTLTAKGGTDVFVAKYGFSGQLVWARQLAGMANESAADVAYDGIGNVYVAGTFTGAADFNPNPAATASLTASAAGSAFLWKLSPTGNLFMARTVGGTSSAASLAVDPSGRIAMTGLFKGTADFNPSPTATNNLVAGTPAGSGFVWRLDPTGNYTWAKPFHSTGTIEMSAVAMDGPGNVYVGGRFTGTADLDPADLTKANVAGGSVWTPFVTRLNILGQYVWGKTARTVNGPAGANNAITGLGVDGIGNVYAAGTFAGTVDFDPGTATVNMVSAGGTDGFAWKLTGTGTLAYARRFGGASPETMADLTVHPSGTLTMAGTFTGVGDFDPNPAAVANLVSGSGAADTYVLKLNPNGSLAYTRAIGGGASTTRVSGLWADGAGNMYLSGGVTGTGDFDPAVGISQLEGGTGVGFVAKIMPVAGAPIKPLNLPPMNITAGGPYLIYEGQGVTVHAGATDLDNTHLTYSWDLNGDGTFGDERGRDVLLTPARMATLGLGDGTNVPRTMTVRISDGVNLPVEATASITIMNLAPAVKLVAPATAVEGSTPTLTLTNIGDPSTADAKAGLHYSWDFNDDGVWDLGDGATYAGSVGTTTFKVPASFTADDGPLAIRVRAFDKDGGKVESTATIEVSNANPTASLQVVGLARAGVPTTIQFVGVKDTTADTTAGFTYGFDLDNDGVFEQQGTSPKATVTFARFGTYTVRGQVTDKDGGSTTYTTTVNVSLF